MFGRSRSSVLSKISRVPKTEWASLKASPPHLWSNRKTLSTYWIEVSSPPYLSELTNPSSYEYTTKRNRILIKARTRTMQTSVIFAAAPSLPLVSTTKSPGSPWKFNPRPQSSRFPLVKAHAVANDPSSVDYSSMTSVFPAEACETLGGEACDVEMYPEVKLKPEPESSKPRTSSEMVDRQYYDYDSPKTVFPGEACDDLGGEFCEPEFQKGVY